MDRRRRAAVAILGLGLTVASCYSPFAPYPFANSVAGRVRVEIELTDPNGAPIGTRTIDDADSVIVYLTTTGRRDSTRTSAGAYRFTHIPPGSWRVAVAVGGVVADTTRVNVGPKTQSIVPDTLVLGRTGDLSASPNPFQFAQSIGFGLAADAVVRLQVESLAGTLKRLLADRIFVSGSHVFMWDGSDDAARPLADGPYSVVFLAGPDRRAEIVVKGP